MLNTKGKAVGGIAIEFDGITQQTIYPASPVYFMDDFIGARGANIPTTASPGEPWIKKIVGAAPPTVAGVANAAAGVIQLALTSTSEKQDVDFYFADNLTFDCTKGLCFECRVQMPVLPSVAGVEAVWGLQSAWIDGPDNASFYVRFQANGSGAVNIQTKDGVNTNTAAAGLTFGTTDWHLFRAELVDPTKIAFFIDGSQIFQATPFAFAATGASAILQPYFSLYKASGTGVGTMNVDYFQAWSNRV